METNLVVGEEAKRRLEAEELEEMLEGDRLEDHRQHCDYELKTGRPCLICEGSVSF
jgi:hypothetical protein